ncbi:MAG: lamin tail domain-containing protein, partial [Bacteroidetes bacterium]|nr:lamin tail domain-containing protein [Bacteroidota bacterium]
MSRKQWIILLMALVGMLPKKNHAQLVINEILINATNANCDGSCMPNTGEWTELYNNSSNPINISCYVLTDGDWSATIPPGTILQPYQIYTIGSVNSQITNLDLNIATCNCTSGPASQVGVFTNGDEQVVIANTTGTIIDGLYWGSGQFDATPSFTTSTLLGCTSVTVNLSSTNPNIQQVTGTVAEAESIFMLCDGTGNLQNSNNTPTPGQPNFSPIQTIDPNETITAISCGGNGSIELNPINGVGPYLYQWQGTLSSNTTNTVSLSTAGNYSVNITDIGQCGAQQSFTFNVISTSTSSISVTATDANLCSGESTDITVTGGGNYVWFPATGLSTTTGDVVIAQPSVTTTYTVSSNFNGCVASQDIQIQVTPLPSGTVSNDSPQCEGSDVQINLNSTNTTNVSWSGPASYSSTALSPILTS